MSALEITLVALIAVFALGLVVLIVLWVDAVIRGRREGRR